MLQIINEIDTIIRSNDWFEFYILNYDGRTLKIGGGIDLVYSHSLEIVFTDIFGVHGFFEIWNSNTKKPVFILPEEDHNLELNLKFEIEKEYQVYIFRTEDYENDVYIAAKHVSFEEVVVKY